MTGPTALEDRDADGARRFSPSAARNRDPILRVFLTHMPRAGAILEIGSGTGEHAVHLAAALPDARFLPGDPDAEARASIAAWTAHSGLSNVAPPHALDVAAEGWERAVARPLAGIVSINMIHIAPFEAARGLFAGAGRLLGSGGRLFLYGPFSRNGAHTARSNAEFDASLKARDPRWGVRDLDRDLLPLAGAAGLALAVVVAMPSNNFSAVFERA
ncbi:MAG: DUF938 domain-containing protein [Parvularculaceae bacterium]|nr:DUF938 domain-containing protein [Parvularculaceae bacterium]